MGESQEPGEGQSGGWRQAVSLAGGAFPSLSHHTWLLLHEISFAHRRPGFHLFFSFRLRAYLLQMNVPD